MHAPIIRFPTSTETLNCSGMAWTTAEKGEGEAATGSRSSLRASRRWNPKAAGSPTPPTVITQLRASQSESSSWRGKRKRSRTAEERRGGRTTGRDGEENAEKEKEQEEEEAVASASPLAEHASSRASSAISSPLRWPSLPHAVLGETAFGETIFEPFEGIDLDIIRAHEKLKTRYFAKQGKNRPLLPLML